MPRTILIADDEPHLVQIVAHNIRKSGATVHIATNGQECIDLANSVKPDLIVSDYQMPILDGMSACIRLREDSRTANIPVLMLTARGHRLTEAELARTNIKTLLPKPFSAKQLLAKIDELLSPPAGGIAA